MYAEERRRSIAARARAEQRVEVQVLAEDLGVTPETIRRDLTELERVGVLRRVHGGAIPAERLREEPALGEKALAMAAEKRRIAKVALEHVPTRGTILLDAGTTTGELASLLPDHELTVVTNSLPIATMLATRQRMTVRVVGGRVRGRTMAAVDGWALRALGELMVDVAFLATNGLSVARGLSTHDPDEAEVKRAMVEAARSRVLLVDHTKVGQEQLVAYARLDALDVVISDSGLDDDAARELAAGGPEVVRA
jgi:DeoR family transcriptional regulator, fructose operon transcriptional repressor